MEIKYLESVRKFASTRLTYPVGELDRTSAFANDAWQACADIGLLGLPVPVEFGGQGADILTTILAFEQVGYHCRDNGLLFSIQAQLWATTMTLARFASDDLKHQFLPGLCNGSLMGAHAMTEANGGSDALALSTTASTSDVGYRINGVKQFVTNAPLAQVILVYATENQSIGAAGVSAFLISTRTPGLEIGPPVEKMGLRTSPMADISFADCLVPRDQRIGGSGVGALLFRFAMTYERAFILAAAVGTMRRQLDDCLDFTSRREQFGRPIADFQAVSHNMAAMYLRLDCSRLLLHDAARAADSQQLTSLQSSLVKLQLSETLIQSSLDTLQIHGAHGYMSESDIERDVRDALASRLYSGTNEIQRQTIADELLRARRPKQRKGGS